jgi:SAM-dependent methyltransferase
LSSARETAPWYEAAFRRGYLDVYAHRDERSAQDEVAFAAAALAVQPGARLLDAGCGAGRHARAFALRGARVIGLDLSAELLIEAQHRGAAQPAGPAYTRGDLRQLPFRTGAFDCVASLFTTFGYFDDAGNCDQLAEFRRVLRSGGRLLLDFLNAARVRATLVPRSEREIEGRRLVEERAVRAGRVEKTVTLTGPGGEQHRWQESVRLYERAELVGLVAATGLDVHSVHGDLAGGAWKETSPRTVLIAVVP